MPMFGIKYLDYAQAMLTGKDKVPYSDWLIYPYCQPFETFEEAKAQAKILEEDSKPHERVLNPEYDRFGSYARYIYVPQKDAVPSQKFVAYKLPASEDYVTREAARVEAGEYEPLPAHMTPNSLYPNDYKFMHPRLIPATETEKAMIGYYPDDLRAREDKLTKAKPTRFFSMYFCQDKIWDFMAELGLISGEFSLIFVNKREDIRAVYEHGPDSCMAGNADKFYSEDIHPVEAYASPDLALAVLIRGNSLDEAIKQDMIVARCLVNVHKNQYVRIYGDICRMEKLLEENGYSENFYALGGCRLLKLFARRGDREERNYIMAPYLDGACTSATLANPDDDYMTIDIPPIRISGSTSGYASIGR